MNDLEQTNKDETKIFPVANEEKKPTNKQTKEKRKEYEIRILFQRNSQAKENFFSLQIMQLNRNEMNESHT